MDYINIIFDGYYNINTNKFLKNYFIREFEKAKKEHYSKDEFFSGCTTICDELIELMNTRMYERQNELYMLENLQKNGMKSSLDKPKTPTEENLKRAENFSKKAENLTAEMYPLNLINISKGKYVGQIYKSEVDFLKQKLLEAKNSINETVIKNPENEELSPFKKDYDDLFSVTEAKTTFLKEGKIINTWSSEKPKNRFDIKNDHVYDFKTNELVSKGKQIDFNTSFIIKLNNLYILDVKPFLKYHFDRTSNKENYLDYLKYAVIPTLNKEILKPVINDWLDSIKKNNQEPIDWISIYNDLDITKNIDVQSQKLTTLEDKKKYFSSGSFNLALQLILHFKQQTYLLNNQRKLDYINSERIEPPIKVDSESPTFNQTVFEGRYKYYEFLQAYKQHLESEQKITDKEPPHSNSNLEDEIKTHFGFLNDRGSKSNSMMNVEQFSIFVEILCYYFENEFKMPENYNVLTTTNVTRKKLLWELKQFYFTKGNKPMPESLVELANVVSQNKWRKADMIMLQRASIQ